MKKKAIETDGPREGLTHNPFAALRGDGQPSAKSPVAKSAAPKPSTAAELGRKLVVRREKKGRGGKIVTRVSGLGLKPEPLAELHRELKRSLGCGASLEDEDILLQGDLTKRAAEWLGARFGTRVTIGN